MRYLLPGRISQRNVFKKRCHCSHDMCCGPLRNPVTYVWLRAGLRGLKISFTEKKKKKNNIKTFFILVAFLTNV